MPSRYITQPHGWTFEPQSSPLSYTNMTKFAIDFYQAVNFPRLREEFLGLLEEANDRRFQIVDERMSDMKKEIKELLKKVSVSNHLPHQYWRASNVTFARQQ